MYIQSPPSFGRLFICLHFSGNAHITNVIYVTSTQSFMLILTTATYSPSSFLLLFDTLCHHVDAIFRISLVFYSNTRVLLHIFFCGAHDFRFVVRLGILTHICLDLRYCNLSYMNKMHLKYSLFASFVVYHNHFRFVTYVLLHSRDNLKTILSIFSGSVPKVFNKQIKILKKTIQCYNVTMLYIECKLIVFFAPFTLFCSDNFSFVNLKK